uniref:GBF-interacting protein 1 N-terminal domain-containing protein n=1 Tax=Physcomitrium patens TaxID=3218 RepID=A0A7I4EL82_PHYPA
MSSGKGSGGGAVQVPASTKKVVQDLKEVVGNSEDEIYAMLKECNMDPNETVQRLLNQDSFHEVKRKRDKKERSGEAKDRDADMKVRPGSGGYTRVAGRGGGGRGGSLPRYGAQGSQEYGRGRGRPYARENDIHPGSGGSSAVSLSSPANAPAKPSGAAPTSRPSPTGAAVPVQVSSAGNISSAGAASGSNGQVRPSLTPQGAWASGHGTIADLLKARAVPPPPPVNLQASAASPAVPAVELVVTESYPAASATVASVSSPESSEFCSSTPDPVLQTSADSWAMGAKSAVGSVGNQRPIGDQPVSWTGADAEVSLDSIAASPSAQASAIPAAIESGNLEVEVEMELAAARPSSHPPAAAPAPSSRDASADNAAVSMEAGTSQGHGSMSALGGNQLNKRPLYVSSQQPMGTQKAVGGGGSEWMGKASGHSSLISSSDGGSQGLGTVDPTSIAQAYQSLNIQDDEPVIIPTHLRVPEADRSHLSFGSFGADFRTSSGLAEVQETKKHVETIAADEASIELPAPSSVETQVEMVQSYGLQEVATPLENMRASAEAPSVANQAPVVSVQEQHTKADPVVQQTPYFLGASNYPGFGLMPQMPGGQYGYEQAESAPQDIPRIPNVVPTYDPTTSYYTSAFPGVESDRLNSHYVPTSSSKYSGNIGLMATPSLLSPEGGNPMLASATPSASAAQSSQPGSDVQTAQVVPQQALPLHYSQPPSAHYGNYVSYQYMPANYPLMQPPYPHHVYNSSSTAYAQPLAGSIYTPAAAVSSFPASGVTAVKYPMPQHKPGATAGNVPHSAPYSVGYKDYITTPSGYASSPAVTAGTNSGYEDVNASPYKDSTLYIPSQQGDGSTVWIQTTMLRDMGPSGSMQTSSYYNVAGQGQLSGYAHSQQPTHGHAHPNAAYSNLYHPSQIGPAPSHQILQQPQGMGSGGGNNQAGAYQRTQRAWNTSNY